MDHTDRSGRSSGRSTEPGRTRSLAVATLAVGCAAVAVAAPSASAVPSPTDLVPQPGPIISYYMGDALNCFVDVRLTIEEDPALGGRQVAFVEPLGIRSTVPGIGAPATCSATLAAMWNDEKNGVPRVGAVRVDAVADRFERARLELDVEPGSQWTSLSFVPQSMVLASYGAFPATSTAVTYGELPI